MASSPTQGILSFLQDDIDLATAQLESLDEYDEEYNVKKMVLEHGLASLEEQKEAAERGQPAPQLDNGKLPSLPIVGSQRPQKGNGTVSSSGFASYAGDSSNRFGGPFATHSMMPTQGRPAPWSFGNRGNTPATPEREAFLVTDTHPASGYGSGPGSGSGSGSSPDSSFLRPQKRQRESLGISDNSAVHPPKSLRTTPSPAMTATTTPTSQGSFDFPDDPTLIALLGGNPTQDMRDMREDQKEQEKALAVRRQQERADEEFARQLEEQENSHALSHDYSRPEPNGASSGTSQTILSGQGRFRRPTPYAFSSSPAAVKEENTFPTSLPVEPQSSYRGNYDPVKNEGDYRPNQLYRETSSDFIDLESDRYNDYQPYAVNGHPSSDLVELDSRAFGGDNQETQTQASSSALGIDNSYGNTEMANASGWGYSSGQLGHSLVDSASNLFNGAYNSAYDFLDQQIAGYGNTPSGFGGTSVYGPNAGGSSSEVIDLEFYDPQSNLPQEVFSRHGINAQDPANKNLVASYMDRIDYVANDPTRTAAEIKSLLENIRPDEELPPENREGTPEAMTYPLMEHQKLGLTWMKSMEDGSNKGGILADAMGLGKTIQALALMVSRKSTDRACKTTLIVCPVALLKQWESEINSKLKASHALKVYTLHSEKRHIDWSKLRTYDVVLTTFGTLGTEVRRREGIEMNKRMNPNWRPSGKSDYLPLLGDECKWYRVIVDEAQCIKNKATKASIGASLLQAKTRFCMTGTPMMNNVSELYSLIHFLRIKPYCEADKFSRDFTRPLKGNSEGLKSKAMRQLQALLKAILLRRTKKSQIDGRPILNLPERTTNACHASFSEDEAAFYSALESRTQLQFNKFLKAGTVGRNYSNILVLLLRLRQACCHPHLIKDFGQASGTIDITPEDMKKLAKELAPDVVNRIKEQCALNEDSALECPVCMDMADNATIFIPCGHNTCSECFARITDPSQAIADGNAEGRVEAKCPNCRGKIITNKVIDSNAFKCVYMPELVTNGDFVDDDSQTDVETTDDGSDSEDDDEGEEDVDSKGNIKGFIVDDDEIVDNSSESEGDGDGSYRSGETPFEKSAKKKGKKPNKGKGKAKEAKVPIKSLAQLKKEGMRNMNARKRYLRRLEKDWVPSAKTEQTIDLLRDIQQRKEPEKTIIFSQFTSLLDLLEVPIARERWDYRRYDGSMSSNARNEAVIDFSNKKECKIMLVSLKAGNAGLNLTVASQVIILDPFWNPYIEEQAIDRAHRIGQQKPVNVHRILVPNTVEDRILALQEKKRELIEGALDEKASQSIGRLGTRELGFLFDVPT